MAVFDSPEINEEVEAQIYDALLHGIQLDVDYLKEEVKNLKRE